MRFSRPLERATLLRRYKRFLADIRFPDGREETVHCPNSGSLLGCKDEGLEVYVLDSGNPERKLRYTWVLVRVGRAFVNVDTGIPNRIVYDAASEQAIPGLEGYTTVRREVAYGKNSRIDVLLEGRAKDPRPCYVEVKSTTLAKGDLGLFPDAVTERGRKHLEEMQREVKRGARAVQLFVLSRTDVKRFRPADAIDPEYGKELRKAARNGVEVIAHRSKITLTGVELGEPVPVDLS